MFKLLLSQIGIVFLLLGLGVYGPATAQTALIAHRSHSGSLATFEPAEVGAGNFGNPYPRGEVEMPDAMADSVIKLSDSTVLVKVKVK